ncbi:hypothetical protein NDU88_002646 [Pleurodeles waltl]|uniref:Uncharacterized protein n=1 Tax=Pleurodeles waltl TaxID=8319 RepID=A0AAV7TLS6_PLEWA|nr:hypothetical protein NDU88_002646 [Pleurodeles waltl]
MFGGEEYTIALDDLLEALLAFRREEEAFGTVSGFQINLSKSQALSLMLRKETVDLLSEQYSFQWQKDSIPYLGIWIAKAVLESSKMNYQLLLQSVKKTCPNGNFTLFHGLAE